MGFRILSQSYEVIPASTKSSDSARCGALTYLDWQTIADDVYERMKARGFSLLSKQEILYALQACRGCNQPREPCSFHEVHDCRRCATCGKKP